LRPQLGIRSFGDDVGDLEVVAAVDRGNAVSGAERSGKPARIVGSAGQPEPPHVHRRAEAVRHQPSRRPQRRRAAVTRHRQRSAHFPGLPIRIAIGDADDPVGLPQRAYHLGAAHQPEAGFGFGGGCQHFQKVPLRHQGDVLVGARNAVQVQLDRDALHIKANGVDEAMRDLSEPLAQA